MKILKLEIPVIAAIVVATFTLAFCTHRLFLRRENSAAMNDRIEKQVALATRNNWVYHLTRGGELLAELTPVDEWRFAEFPCVEAQYTTTDAFTAVKPLFDREAMLLDTDDEAENNEWADIWDELKSVGLFVESPDGSERFDILWIHFKDGRAWWWPLFNSPESKLPAQQ